MAVQQEEQAQPLRLFGSSVTDTSSAGAQPPSHPASGQTKSNANVVFDGSQDAVRPQGQP